MAHTKRAAKRKGAVDDTDLVEDVSAVLLLSRCCCLLLLSVCMARLVRPGHATLMCGVGRRQPLPTQHAPTEWCFILRLRALRRTWSRRKRTASSWKPST